MIEELKCYKMFHRASALTSPEFISVVEFGNGDEVYFKSEADKVIAKLEERIADGNKDFEMANHQNERLLKIVRHHKYKRCVAMAQWCGEACDKWMMRKAKAISLGKDGVEVYHRARRKLFHYMKWQKRWLELADKFKEAK